MAFFGVTAKNDEQRIALNYLNDNKDITIITGNAGTGKNIISQAVGLENVLETQRYNKMIYTRLQVQLGIHLGFLTGDLAGKTEPFVLPFLDNLDKMDSSKMSFIKDYLFSEKDEKKQKVFFDSIQTMRGRSLDHTYLMVDEVQNTDNHTMKAIGTRIDKGSKLVLVGNFAQIDEPKLRDPKKNGLYNLLKGLYERDPNKTMFEHIHLQEQHRSRTVGVIEDIFSSEDDVNPLFTELEMRGAIEKLQEVI